jgi:copper chaperone CopZ
VLAGGLSGATAAVEELDVRVEGIQCSLCVTALQRMVTKLPGVKEVTVTEDPRHLRVTALPGRGLDLAAIREQLLKSGYQPDEDEVIGASGMVKRGERDHLTFSIPGAKEEYDLLEGAPLRALLQELPAAGPPVLVSVQGRVHRHPADLPPSLSILSYEVQTRK